MFATFFCAKIVIGSGVIAKRVLKLIYVRDSLGIKHLVFSQAFDYIHW